MKKISYIFLLSFFLISTNYSQQGWVTVFDNFPYYTRQFDFINDSVGIIICNDDKILKTTNGGKNWYIVYTASQLIPKYVTFINNDTGFIGSINYKILMTTNQGQSFNEILVNGENIVNIKFINNLTGYAISRNYPEKLLKTTNTGINWQVIYNDNHGSISTFVDFDISDDSNIYIVVEWYNSTQHFSLSKSSNGGINFVDIYNDRIFTNVNFINSSTGFMTGFSVFKTTNSGFSWKENAFPNVPQNGIIFNNNIIYLINQVLYTYHPSIYYSNNYGANWNQSYLNNSYEGGFYGIKFINNNTGYALGGFIGTNGVLLKTTNGGIPVGINPISSEIPNNFSLNQNYPNPFNPSTKIKFSIPKSSSVAQTFLSVYNVLGKEIATLVNQQLQPGTYEVDWDASAYPSGIYFYTLRNSNFTETKKLILIK